MLSTFLRLVFLLLLFLEDSLAIFCELLNDELEEMRVMDNECYDGFYTRIICFQFNHSEIIFNANSLEIIFLSRVTRVITTINVLKIKNFPYSPPIILRSKFDLRPNVQV